MKSIIFPIIIVLLAGCVSKYPPTGKWIKKEASGKTEFNITSSKSCWWIAKGEFDGIGFECTISHEKDNTYKVIILERDGSFKSENYFHVTIQSDGNVVMKMKERTMLLIQSN
jgi:hypothetical protein